MRPSCSSSLLLFSLPLLVSNTHLMAVEVVILGGGVGVVSGCVVGGLSGELRVVVFVMGQNFIIFRRCVYWL